MPAVKYNIALQGDIMYHQQGPEFRSHLSDVVRHRDLELPVHEGLLWVRNQVVQHILEEKWDRRHLCVCACMSQLIHDEGQYHSLRNFHKSGKIVF